MLHGPLCLREKTIPVTQEKHGFFSVSEAWEKGLLRGHTEGTLCAVVSEVLNLGPTIRAVHGGFPVVLAADTCYQTIFHRT